MPKRLHTYFVMLDQSRAPAIIRTRYPRLAERLAKNIGGLVDGGLFGNFFCIFSEKMHEQGIGQSIPVFLEDSYIQLDYSPIPWENCKITVTPKT